MQKRMKIGLAAVTFAALGFAALGAQGLAPAAAQTDGFSEGQVKGIEKIVKDYLINHPEVLLEAQDALEKKQEAMRTEAVKAKLPAFYKTLADLAPQLSSMSIGSGDVTVVEFFDYNCGYCRKTLPDLIKLTENDRNVKVQLIEYPILAPDSIEAAKVGIAAAKQGKYWEFHKAMFAAGRASKESALKVAEQLGLDMTRVQADMASPETMALLTKLAEAGKQMFIDGTPSFIVGDKISPGWNQYDQLKELVAGVRKEGCKACSGEGGVKDGKKS